MSPRWPIGVATIKRHAGTGITPEWGHPSPVTAILPRCVEQVILLLYASRQFESRSTRWLGVVAVLLLTVAGCAAPPSIPDKENGEPPLIETPPTPIEGEELDMAILSGVSEVARTESLLLARYHRNKALAKGLDASTLMAIDSRLAWFEGQLTLADELLNTLGTDNSNVMPFVRNEHEYRSAAAGRWLAAAEYAFETGTIERSPAITNPIKDRIFGYLMRADREDISRELKRKLDSEWRYWLEMQQAYREGQSALKLWRQNALRSQMYTSLPDHINKWLDNAPRKHMVAMLPLAGALEAAGEAVLEGIVQQLYSLYPDPTRRPRLSTLNSTAYDNAAGAYRAASEHDADLIIGPLTKKEVSELAQLAQLPVPIIALNQSPSLAQSASANWMSFSLAPEDEAQQIAEEAFGRACRNAIVISGADERGGRLLSAFGQRWAHLGGKIRGQLIIEELSEANELLGQLLGSGSSDQRIGAIEKAFDLPVDSRGRGRSDFECIFMLASDPTTARAWRPLLIFHMTGNTPVYATSGINDGIDNARNRDLNGVLFIEAPAMLPPHAPDRLTRLRALGNDAVLLSQHWHQALATDNWLIQGRTGVLRRKSNGSIERVSDLATFDGAKVRHAGVR